MTADRERLLLAFCGGNMPFGLERERIDAILDIVEPLIAECEAAAFAAGQHAAADVVEAQAACYRHDVPDGDPRWLAAMEHEARRLAHLAREGAVAFPGPAEREAAAREAVLAEIRAVLCPRCAAGEPLATVGETGDPCQHPPGGPEHHCTAAEVWLAHEGGEWRPGMVKSALAERAAAARAEVERAG